MSQLALQLPHSPSYAHADFCVSECNREAMGWIERWPDWPTYALLLIGPAGSGKTHLATIWQAKANAKAWRFSDSPDVAGNVLLEMDRLDDERTLFHLLNTIREKQYSLLLTASTPVRDWSIQLADLRSRLLALPVATLHSPDDAALSAALAKQFADRQLEVGAEAQRYILSRSERSFAAIQAIATALDEAALKQQKPVTLKLVKEVLSAWA